ncbi:hypothetical protein Bpla01_23020 [Burkholderia plantarii]|nr:hypothetical protein Bpla01_23020 [Burkholderia plantarii]
MPPPAPVRPSTAPTSAPRISAVSIQRLRWGKAARGEPAGGKAADDGRRRAAGTAAWASWVNTVSFSVGGDVPGGRATKAATINKSRASLRQAHLNL